MIKLSRLLILSTALLSPLSSAEELQPKQKPNVLIFFIDDLGWTDIGANGSTFHETPHIDALAGIPLKPKQHLDGLSLKPLLQKPTEIDLKNRVLAWTSPHVHGTGHKPSDSILHQGWKLIRFESDEPSELYQLSTDLSEKTNLAEKNPQKVQELEQRLDAWLKETQ